VINASSRENTIYYSFLATTHLLYAVEHPPEVMATIFGA
jgi:hypothetical protein